MPAIKRFVSDTQSIIQSSSALFLMRITGAAIAFVIQIIIARYFGADDLGQYLIMLALANIIANLIPQGYQMTGAYFVSSYRYVSEREQLRGFLLTAYRRTLFGSVICLLIACLVFLIGKNFIPDRLFTVIIFALILAPAMSLIFMNGSVLVGLKRPVIGHLPDMILRPTALLCIVMLITLGGQSQVLSYTFWVAVVIIWLIALGQVLVVDRLLPAFPHEDSKNTSTENLSWQQLALPWLLIALITEFILDIDILFLSTQLSAENLAIFGVCLRLFALLGFAVNAIYIIVLPEMFSSSARKDDLLFQQHLAQANTLATLVACLCLLLAIFLGDPILAVFGENFLIGRPVLIILMIALIFRTVFGPAHVVLSLHDYPYAALPILFVGLGILLISNLILIPMYGLAGAAIALTLSYAFWSISLWYLTRSKTGLDISLFATLKSQ